KGATVLMDNTWATPLYFRAFEKGVDLEIQAGTKYIGGHSDIMFGCVSANAATLPALKDTVYSMGICVGPDDMYLALRGLRTLGVRLARHYQSGLRIARWLAQRPVAEKAAHAFLNELTLFGLGYSWGGFESLAILFDCTEYRTATKWAPGGPSIRFHIGLEDPDDLIADLERGFAALAKAG